MTAPDLPSDFVDLPAEPVIHDTADAAEEAFYSALNRFDLEQMMTVWDDDDAVYCIHPGGQRISGPLAIRETWRMLFDSGAKLQVQTVHATSLCTPDMEVHSVMQHVSIVGDDRLHPPIMATNVFRKGEQGWKMIVHHASPTPDLEGLLGMDTPRVVH